MKLILLIFSFQLCANEYFINGKKANLINKVIEGKHSSVISKQCFYKNNCLALIAYKKAKTLKLNLIADEGLSIGNEVCRKFLDGKINYSRDKEGNEINLCEFKDGSMIDLASITP